MSISVIKDDLEGKLAVVQQHTSRQSTMLHITEEELLELYNGSKALLDRLEYERNERKRNSR